jgi:mannose-6-phosphate isomerase
MTMEQRPWGYFEILAEAPECKVKKIVVYPGRRLSLQRHRQRSEHWYFLAGEGVVTLDSVDIEVKSGETVNIPMAVSHRIRNTGRRSIIFVEIQTGEYFGEDDIERLEDDYGRA